MRVTALKRPTHSQKTAHTLQVRPASRRGGRWTPAHPSSGRPRHCMPVMQHNRVSLRLRRATLLLCRFQHFQPLAKLAIRGAQFFQIGAQLAHPVAFSAPLL